MFDRHEQRTTELHQNNRDGGDNVGRDKIIHNHLYGSVDYQQLLDDIEDAEEMLAIIPQDKIDLRLKQAKKVEELKQRLEDFKEDVFRLHELFTRIPINTERLRKAKAYFDKGEFREADAVLKAEEIQQDVDRLHKEKGAVKERLAAIEQDLEGRAQEFLLKARLSLLTPIKEGEDRFQRTEQWFAQALATARTTDVLFEYAKFFRKHNAFSRAEPLYQEVLKVYRRKAKADPQAFLPRVADTLNNLAVLHDKTKEYDLCLKEYKEVLKLRRSLAETEPKAFLPKVAGALNNLGILHRTIWEYGPARQEYEEALKIYRSLAKAEPKTFLPKVAGTLNNIGILHRTIWEYGSAQQEYEEALKIYRTLAEAESKVFLPALAESLNNFAVLHQEVGEHDPALKEYEEALKIRRNLAEVEPKAFLPDVAGTLNNLAALHTEIQSFGLALKEYEEALKIRRNLAEAEPKAFLPDVADTLNNLANLHQTTGEYVPALQEYKEALMIRRALAEKEPGAFSQVLTETLLNLSIFYLQAVPDKAKSVDYAQEARDILIPLCQQAPHLQNYLDKAEQVLAANKAKPEE